MCTAACPEVAATLNCGGAVSRRSRLAVLTENRLRSCRPARAERTADRHRVACCGEGVGGGFQLRRRRCRDHERRARHEVVIAAGAAAHFRAQELEKALRRALLFAMRPAVGIPSDELSLIAYREKASEAIGDDRELAKTEVGDRPCLLGSATQEEEHGSARLELRDAGNQLHVLAENAAWLGDVDSRRGEQAHEGFV